jgi:hypothetical protein
MSEVTERAIRYVAICGNIDQACVDIINGLLTELQQITELTAQLKTVSIALLDAHSGNCMVGTEREHCIYEVSADRDCLCYKGPNHHDCKHYKPCECEACFIAGEAAL